MYVDILNNVDKADELFLKLCGVKYLKSQFERCRLLPWPPKLVIGGFQVCSERITLLCITYCYYQFLFAFSLLPWSECSQALSRCIILYNSQTLERSGQGRYLRPTVTALRRKLTLWDLDLAGDTYQKLPGRSSGCCYVFHISAAA